MNVSEYLARIHYEKTPRADVETLFAFQYAHMLYVPFENLDISLGRKIKLDEQSLWDKIIVRKRGGFCYEVNGLFAWLLKSIGFDVTYLNARDYHENDGTFGIDFDHLALMVKTPEDSTRWLVDVGWGDNFYHPLDIDNPNEQVQGLRGYWVKPFMNGYQVAQRNYDGSKEDHYFFNLIPHSFPDEYLDTCTYHQTSPDSIFTKKRIISRLTEDGRISLDNDTLIVTKNGEKTFEEIGEDRRERILKEYFDVRL